MSEKYPNRNFRNEIIVEIRNAVGGLKKRRDTAELEDRPEKY